MRDDTGILDDEGIRPRISEILEGLVERQTDPRLSVDDIVAALKDRGYGLLILVLTLPNLVPVYLPGLSAVFGLPLAFIALQLMLGRPGPWLPRFVLRRSFSRKKFATLVNRALPYLRRTECFLQPRRLEFTAPLAERFIGTACLVLALLLSLPIPLTNIPLALPLALLSLGLLERDGWFVIAGFGLALTVIGAILMLSWTLLVELALPFVERTL